MSTDVRPPPTEEPASTQRAAPSGWRLAGLVSCSVTAFALAAVLFAGVESRGVRVACLLLAGGAVAGVAALLPTSWRARTALVATTFVAAVGVLPVVMAEDPGPGPTPDTLSINADYLAQVLRQGPFTEPLPAPLVASGLADINIGDSSAAHRVDAVQLVLTNSEQAPGPTAVAALAWIETYRSEDEAHARAEAAFSDAKERYDGFGGFTGDAAGFCVVADTYWLCGGSRGMTYAEVDLSPNPNSTNGLATSTLAALLDYSARAAKVAATD